MSVREKDWPYWSVDLPGLSRAQAQELLEMAERAGMPAGGTAVDPESLVTLHLDRATVESLVRVLDAARTNRLTLDIANIRTITGVLEVLQEWIGNASSE